MALTDAAVAIAVGLAFGMALERAGLGSARKLTGQFFLTDLTVFKVMFSAIVTAMLGTFWLGRLGAIDFSLLYVPDTYLPAQALGGLIFGAGFAIAGLCPGTACVAASTGRGDGMVAAAGMFFGVLVTGLAFPLIGRLYSAGAHGAWTLPQLLGLPYGVVVLGIVLVALGGFAAAGHIERRAPIIGASRVVWFAIAALTLAAAAAIVRTPQPAPAVHRAAPGLFRPANGC